MAGVTWLRDAARAVIFSSGGRGFVRFLSEGEALLISDAPRRSESEPLMRALNAAGFIAEIRDGLLYITPGEEILCALCAQQPGIIVVRWESSLFEAQALCERLLSEETLAMDEDAQRLIIETVRLLWQPGEKVLAGLPLLRARIAVSLREGRKGGLHEAGRLLCGWLEENRE